MSILKTPAPWFDRTIWGHIAILVCLGALAYSNSFPGAFHFDDFELMLESPRVAGEYFDYELFLNHYGGRPLTLWTFHVNHRWSGDDPATYHAVSLLLHLLAGVLLYRAACTLGLGQGAALLGAAIFLVHPLQSQPVNYVWSRSLLLMSVWSLVSVLTIKKSRLIGLGAFQLAVWSRAEALVLVPLLMVLNRRWWWAPVLLGCLNLLGVYRGILLEEPSEFGPAYADSASYWWAQPWVFMRYLSFMIWPSGLSVDHGVEEVGSIEVLVPAFLFLAGVLIFFLFDFHHGLAGQLGVVLGLSVLMLLPSALIANPDVLNESRPYLALAGVSLAIAMLLLRAAGSNPVARVVVGAVILVPLILATRARNEVWQRDVDLWMDAVEKAPRKSLVHYNLGSSLAREGHTARARQAFLDASRLNPFDDLSYAGLGYCAEMEGLMEVAERYYLQAVELAPANSYAQEAVARVRALRGRNPREH